MQRPLVGRRTVDVLGVVLAALYALPTVGYPPARDQALFFYVAREWLHGALPYRDVFDIKPPGIFVVNAVSILLFGLRPWGVRVLELGGILTMASLAARTVARDAPRRAGELAALALVLVGWYFGAFDWVDTAEPEFWEGLALIASYCAATTLSRINHAAVVSGALVGAAVLLKFPAAVVGLACTAAVALRGRGLRARLAASALHGLAAVVVVGVSAAYFALRGGWSSVGDAFGYVLDYQRHSPAPSPELARAIVFDFWVARGWPWVGPILVGWIFAVVAAIRRRSWGVLRGAFASLGLLALAFASVVLQRRFNAYYWAVTTPFVACCAAYGFAALARSSQILAILGGSLTLLVGFAKSPPWIHNPGGHTYRTHLARAVRYVVGTMDRQEYLASFVGFAGYSYPASERVGVFLRERAHAGDELVVRGYEPAVYVVSGLRSPSRFATDIALWQAGVTYKRTQWAEDHERIVWAAHPRFIVAAAFDLADRERIVGHGYVELTRDGDFVVLAAQADASP